MPSFKATAWYAAAELGSLLGLNVKPESAQARRRRIRRLTMPGRGAFSSGCLTVRPSPFRDVLLEVHGLVRGSGGGVRGFDAQVVEGRVTGHGGGDGQPSLREHALRWGRRADRGKQQASLACWPNKAESLMGAFWTSAG